MNIKDIVNALPDRYREGTENVLERVSNPPKYTKYPYFAVLPAFEGDDGKYHILHSSLTNLSIKTLVKTSGGFVTAVSRSLIPLIKPLSTVFGYSMITPDNISHALHNALTKCKFDNLKTWVYLKAEEMIALKISEIFSTAKFGNLSPARFRRILNNVAGMCSEYQTFKYDMIERKVIFPEWFSHEMVKPNRLVAVTDCPQTEKNTFRLCVGADVKHGRGIEGRYIISDIHTMCPSPDKISHNRLIVQRALTQAMELINPDEPVVVSGIQSNLEQLRTANLLSVRMEFKGMTHEDGIVISQSAAEKLIAIQRHDDRVQGTIENIKVCPLEVTDEFAVDHYLELINTLRDTSAVIRRGSTIAVDKFGQKTVTSLKVPGLVTGITEQHGGIFIKSFAMHQLSIGDKLMDMHGNKGVISTILPNKKMPKIEIDGKKYSTDIIFAPYIVKRCDPSRIIEEERSMAVLRSLVGNARRKDNGKTITNMSQMLRETRRNNVEMIRTGIGYGANFGTSVSSVTCDGKTYENIPYGVVRVARLDHIARTKLAYYTKTRNNQQGKQLRVGYAMADNIFHLYKNGCTQTIRDIMKSSSSRRVNDILFSLGFTLAKSGIKRIRKRLSLDMLRSKLPAHVTKDGLFLVSHNDYPRKVTPDNIEDETKGTVVDKRSTSKFMMLKVPKWLTTDISVDRVRMDIKHGEYLVIPPMNVFNLSDGTMTVNQIQNLLQRLITQMQSDAETSLKIESCKSLIYAIYSTISGKLFTKSGLVRGMLFPRTSMTGYGVIVPNPEIHIDEVMIPYVMMKRFAKEMDTRQRKLYNITPDMSCSDMDIHVKGYALSTRFPGHREQNAIALKIRVWNEYAIGLHPAIVPIQDGDFDGDMEMIYMPKNKTSMKEIVRAFSLETHIKHRDVEFNHSRCLRHLPTDIYKHSMEDINKIVKDMMYNSTGLGEERTPDKRYKKTVQGLDITSKKKSVFGEAVKARRDVSYMKRGAANAGNIGLSLRALSQTPEELGLANQIYHILAQSALDGKNSEGNVDFVEYVCEALRMGTSEVKRILSEENKEFNEEQKTYLRKLLYSQRGLQGLAAQVAMEHPLAHACMTGNLRDITRATDINKHDGCYEMLYHEIKI